jgi:hypothetical protein
MRPMITATPGLGGTGHVATLEETRAHAARGTAEVSA